MPPTAPAEDENIVLCTLPHVVLTAFILLLRKRSG